MSDQFFRLPDILRDWPCESRLSPFYEEAKAESSSWIKAFHPFDHKGQRAFDGCDFSLLASLTYSNRDREFIRLASDLMNIFFVYDEYTDFADPSLASRLAQIVMDAMRMPDRISPLGKHLLGDMTRDFWLRAASYAQPCGRQTAKRPACLGNFMETMERYLVAVIHEAKGRAEAKVSPVNEYLELRRRTSGAEPTLAFIEFGLDLDEEVLQHPTIKALNAAAVEMIVIDNDMHSYMREVTNPGMNENVISCLMHHHGLDLQASFDWLGDYSDRIVAEFNTKLRDLPSFGAEVDRRVETYVEGLAQWIRGEDDWSLKSKRYYGNEGQEIQKTRIVMIRPVEGNYLRP